MNDTPSLPIEKLIGQLNELSDEKLSESDLKAAYAAIDQYLKASSSLESESRSATSETKPE